ncbi:NAD(P)/FAD-dependent oxidoreductase [Mycolicibacter hiberniae]|uniref:Dehydrogenase n=1 Tax=Mycolicibacter hiberniae TaxID=29314 RepID=A0A7I7WZC8_9MYCO|nr:FAD-dependent oxidoreductase [Mycolicibacter hiberniae]MCV7084396.1 FAD-dependent oxidoreductase [Mycolicibacter hiberniae]BBZ22929.1 dehydrogenase [Mycolicibacter hiberniae]
MSANNARLSSLRNPHVVVIGGGYAGALAANRLQQNPDLHITIINPRPVFVERVRLHEFVAGSGDATVDLAALLGDRVNLIVDTATRIDAAARTVELASGSLVSYDYLLYAVGSTGTVPEGVAGARAHAYPIGELEQAERLRAAVDLLPDDAPICVVGGGLTGIEAASELAEQRPHAKVSLLCGGILAAAVGEKARASVRRQLTKLGVSVEDEALVEEVLADRVRLSDGRSLPSGVTVWTAGFGVPDLATRSGLTTDSIGRLVTDESLTSIDDPWIFGAGDASAPAGPPLRMSCQAAMPLAARATSTVLARIAGSEVKVLNQSFVGSNISIGRRHGTIAVAHHDDSPRSLYIGGRLAAFIKEMVCTTVVKQIAKESRKPGSYRWPGANKAPVPVKSAVG